MILPILATICVLSIFAMLMLESFPVYYSRAYDIAYAVTGFVILLSGTGSLIAAIWRFLA
jgi:hypothetical protein